jgi:hypothetical protein
VQNLSIDFSQQTMRSQEREHDNFGLTLLARGFAAIPHSYSVCVRLRLEHVPEKWTRFSDKDMLQVFELARILFDQVIST